MGDERGYSHTPVMVAEVLGMLEPKSGCKYLDGTVGGGGHAVAILAASGPDGWLLGLDRDAEAVRAAVERLAPFAGRFELRHASFADAAAWVPAGSFDGALLDLGISSYQLETAERGFSLQRDGPLDMRFDRSMGTTAAQLLNQLEVEELARLFWELGGERHARPIARAIERERRVRPLERTPQLAALVERVARRAGRHTHPATKVFQALRLAVNDELGSLRRGLAAVWGGLRLGGRLAVISFHSGEDRVVREFGRGLVRDYEVSAEVDVPELRRPRASLARWITRKAVRPGRAELTVNARARSAQLRCLEKRGG
jgi:16S rRNA (cytosine1402-N4)-methyltransferase